MPRLFIALRPPPPIRAALCRTMQGVVGARWQNDEQLHLTIRFLGDVDGHTADDLAIGLASITAPAPTLAIDGVGTFGKQGRPNSLWAAVPLTTALREIHKQVGSLLRRRGLSSDGRAFTPHITLARLNRSSGQIHDWSAKNAGLRIEPFVCDHLYLYESEVARTGSVYTVAARHQLP